MNWTPREIQMLVKKAYGNFTDEKILRKAAELRLHLNMHESAIFNSRARSEWTEVERIAGELDAMIHLSGGGKKETPLPEKPAPANGRPARRGNLMYREKISALSHYVRSMFHRPGVKH